MGSPRVKVWSHVAQKKAGSFRCCPPLFDLSVVKLDLPVISAAAIAITPPPAKARVAAS